MSEKDIFSYITALVNQSSEMLLNKNFQVISENFMNSPTPNLKSWVKEGVQMSLRCLYIYNLEI